MRNKNVISLLIENSSKINLYDLLKYNILNLLLY